MSSAGKNCLWISIQPIMRFWIISYQIQNLKKFLLQIKNWTKIQAIFIIWRIVQSDFDYKSKEIETEIEAQEMVYHCAHISHWFTSILQTMKIQELFSINLRFNAIKEEIRDALQRNQDMDYRTFIPRLATRLISISPYQIMEELVFHYNDILSKLEFNFFNSTDIEITPKLFEYLPEHQTMQTRLLRNSSKHVTQIVLVMHEKLVDQIITHRQTAINELITTIEQRVVFLQEHQLNQ